MQHIDPRVKLVAMLVSWFYIVSLNQLGILTGLAMICWGMAVLAGTTRDLQVGVLAVGALIFIQFLALQLLFGREGNIIGYLGPWEYHDGALPLAFTSACKVVAIAYSSLGFFTSTDGEKLTLMQVKLGIPYRFAMLFSIALRFLPVLQREVQIIYLAQRTRGVPLDYPWQKAVYLFPATVPFFFRSYRTAIDSALSIELRGFGYAKTRTFMTELHMEWFDWLYLLVLLSSVSCLELIT